MSRLYNYKLNYKHLLLMALVTLCSCLYTNAQSLSPVKLHGQLRVADGKIVDSNNEAPQLRGISLSWSIWAGKKYYNRNVVNWLQHDFGISLLRVAMAVEPAHGYLQDSARQMALVTEVVDAAIQKG